MHSPLLDVLRKNKLEPTLRLARSNRKASRKAYTRKAEKMSTLQQTNEVSAEHEHLCENLMQYRDTTQPKRVYASLDCDE